MISLFKIEESGGNSTVQTLKGDTMIIESLYERWEDVALPVAEFELILDRYADYLGTTDEE